MTIGSCDQGRKKQAGSASSQKGTGGMVRKQGLGSQWPWKERTEILPTLNVGHLSVRTSIKNGNSVKRHQADDKFISHYEMHDMLGLLEK